MGGAVDPALLVELHGDLAKRYKNHGPRLEQIWRSLSQGQRAKAMKAGTADGVVLEHSLDASMGNVCKFLPEWNLRDITAPGSDLLLYILKHRATTSLEHQYIYGFNGRPGDHQLIVTMMQTRNLRHTNPFKDCYTAFWDSGSYGNSFKVVKDKKETLASLAPAFRASLCVPQSVGELVLTRQLYLMQSLTIIIEDILEEGSTTRNQNQPPKKSTDTASKALSKLSIQAPPSKLDLPDLLNSALDQKASLDDDLNLLCTEPVVLAHAVNKWFYSRPELVADERGRMFPAHTDKYISGAIFEAVHSAVKAAAIWNYMSRLLELLGNSANKSQRAIILQEIANLCHLEYTRAQALFKRQVTTIAGSKWFKRISNVYDNGNVRVTMKAKPELLTREDPQLHYMLRLCQPETNASKAVDWMMKLDDLHGADSSEREVVAVYDLAVIIGFIHSLSPVISMPSINRKKGHLFVSRSIQLEGELNKLKPQLDLTEFAVPIDNLLEPGMAEGALKALDRFIVEQTGTKLGFLYQDIIEDCVSHLQDQLKAKTEQQSAAEYVPFPPETPQPPEVQVEQRKLKEKTRPVHSSIYEITSSAQKSALNDPEAIQPPPPSSFKVKSSTAEVFSTLFSRSESRGSVPWVNFESAMADLGFSVIPKFGSVYTFFPPKTMPVQRPVTLHRPHRSRIDGYLVLTFARRLRRVYGWIDQTFQVT
ncbi:hypothetical protein F5B20DRAFT_2517 [Whalleya microplaca]|nr:hypothetical protein F5B20DRAFT_2517 [Whalleya microplaca]